jgi:hemolysin activation/secretion protein
LAGAQAVPLERGLSRYHLANSSDFVEPHGIKEAGKKHEKIELVFSGDVESLTPLIQYLAQKLLKSYRTGHKDQHLYKHKLQNIDGYKILLNISDDHKRKIKTLDVHIERKPFGVSTEYLMSSRKGGSSWSQPTDFHYYNVFGFNDNLRYHNDFSFLHRDRVIQEFEYTLPLGVEETDFRFHYNMYRIYKEDKPLLVDRSAITANELGFKIRQTLMRDPHHILRGFVGILNFFGKLKYKINPERNVRHRIDNLWFGLHGKYIYDGGSVKYDVDFQKGIKGFGASKNNRSTDTNEIHGSLTALISRSGLEAEQKYSEDLTFNQVFFLQLADRTLLADQQYNFGGRKNFIFAYNALSGDNGFNTKLNLKYTFLRNHVVDSINIEPGLLYGYNWNKAISGVQTKSHTLWGLYTALNVKIQGPFYAMVSYGLPIRNKTASFKYKNKFMIKAGFNFKF